MSVAPGDVVLVHTVVGHKRKFHLCVSIERCFVLLNSYRGRDYEGSFVVDNGEFPFLTPTETGKSVVNCSMVLFLTKAEIAGAKVLGQAKPALMQMIFDEAERSEVLSDDHREAILGGLGDWL